MKTSCPPRSPMHLQVLFTSTLYFLVGFQPIASKFFIFLAFVSVAGVSTGAECQSSGSHSEELHQA